MFNKNSPLHSVDFLPFFTHSCFSLASRSLSLVFIFLCSHCISFFIDSFFFRFIFFVLDWSDKIIKSDFSLCIKHSCRKEIQWFTTIDIFAEWHLKSINIYEKCVWGWERKGGEGWIKRVNEWIESQDGNASASASYTLRIVSCQFSNKIENNDAEKGAHTYYSSDDSPPRERRLLSHPRFSISRTMI